MQVQNPDYLFYKKLAGKWKSVDGSCTAELTSEGFIKIGYAGASLSSRFRIIQTGPEGIGFSPNLMMGFMGMGMAQNAGGMTVKDLYAVGSSAPQNAGRGTRRSSPAGSPTWCVP